MTEQARDVYLIGRIEEAKRHRQQAIVRQLRYGSVHGALDTARAYTELIHHLESRLDKHQAPGRESMKKYILAVLVGVAVTAMAATSFAEPVGNTTSFLRDHSAQISTEAGLADGNGSGGSAMTIRGMGAKVSYGGKWNGSNVGMVIDSRTLPSQALPSLLGVQMPYMGGIQPFFDLGVGFAKNGKEPVLSVGGGLSVDTGIRALGGTIVVNAGYSKLQGVIAGLGIRY